MSLNISTARERWTGLSIWLHWLIVLLLLAQFAEGEWMTELFDKGAAIASDTTAIFGYTHIAVGSAIFLAAGVRLWDRLAHGRPAYPDGEPGWAHTLARINHALLYAFLLGMPVVGLAAFLTGNHLLAEVHVWTWTALLVVAGLHVVGALANHFWFRTSALVRMLPGQGRRA